MSLNRVQPSRSPFVILYLISDRDSSINGGRLRSCSGFPSGGRSLQEGAAPRRLYQ